MKRTTLLIAALAIAVIATATPAFAMRDPGAGGGMAMYNYGPQPPRIGQNGLNGQYADGMNLYQYVRSQPTRLRDPLGLACCDQCEWGAKKDVKADDVQLKAASSKMSPGCVAAAEAAVVNAQAIGKLSSLANLGTGATQGATSFATSAAAVLAEEAMGAGSPAEAMVKKIKGEIATKLNKAHGVVIWVHVTYKNCEWTRCYPWVWKGANDWVEKDGWHRCSKESPQAPLFGSVGEEDGPKLSAGFPVSDTAGITSAIPICIKEAIDNVKK